MQAPNLCDVLHYSDIPNHAAMLSCCTALHCLQKSNSLACLKHARCSCVGESAAGSEDQHQAWKCMEDAIAISMLLATCRSMHSLQSLVIRFQHVGTLHQTVREHAPRKDPFQDISRIYSHVWFDLQELLSSSLYLRYTVSSILTLCCLFLYPHFA